MSEKRKNIESPKPTTSKLKLKTKKKTNLEESKIVNNGETTPKRYSAHSTPIRKSKIINNVEDSPEMDYRYSPIMGIPSTQQNEVLWSWHSPKEEKNTSSDLKTPKRSSQLHCTRRIADSPLMFASLKVGGKKPESNFDQFLANFEQFNNQTVVIEQEPVASTSANTQINEKTNSNLDKNLETSDEADMQLVYPGDDEWLERCSQMVEAELLAKEKQSDNFSLLKTEERVFHESGKTISGLQDLIKVPIEMPRETNTKQSEKIITIPDDSFDDYLSQFPEDDFKRIETPPKPAISRPNKFAPKKSLFTSNSNLGTAKSCSNFETKKMNTSGNDRTLVKTKSFDCCGKVCPLLGKTNSKKFEQQNNERQISDPSPRKFFKSKSYSEPFSNDPKSSVCNQKSTDDHSFFPNVQNNRKIIGKSLKCKIYSDSSFNQSTENVSMQKHVSSESNGHCLVGNSFNNVPLSNPRFMDQQQIRAKEEAQEILCTAEEIERKRIEAKMKLEAKRRIQNSRLNKTITTKILPIAESVKR